MEQVEGVVVVVDVYTEGGEFLSRVKSEEDNVEIVMALLCSELQQREEFKDIHAASLGFKYFDDDKDVHYLASLKNVSKLKLCSTKGRLTFNYREHDSFQPKEKKQLQIHFILPDGSKQSLSSPRALSTQDAIASLEYFFPKAMSPLGTYKVDTTLTHLSIQETYKIIKNGN